jgi:hypothetical protein
MKTRTALLSAVIVVSVAAFFWPLVLGTKPTELKDFVTMIPVVTSLFGLANEDTKSKKAAGREKSKPSAGAKIPPPPPASAKPFLLTPSFESGIYGGLIGGALAGVLVGASYYLAGEGAQIVMYIFAYAAITGMVLGAATQLGMLGLRYLAEVKGYAAIAFNEVTGGLVGGACGGIVAGALGASIFGQRQESFPDIGLLATGIVLGSISIILGALMYSYEGHWRNVFRSLVSSTVVAVFVAVPGMLVASALNIDTNFFSSDATVLQNVQGGAIIGIVFGIVVGLELGLTLRLYRLWQVSGGEAAA